MSHDPLDHADISEPVPHDEAQGQQFEDLTLAETLGQFVRKPLITIRSLFQVARAADDATGHITVPQDTNQALQKPIPPTPSEPNPLIQPFSKIALQRLSLRHYFVFGLFAFAFLLALTGNRIMVGETLRAEQTSLNPAASWLIVAFFVWVGAELYFSWHEVKAWWSNQSPRQHVLTELRGIPVAILLLSLIIILVVIFNAPYNLDVWGSLNIGFGLAVLGAILWFALQFVSGRWMPHFSSEQMQTDKTKLNINATIVRGLLAVVGLVLSSVAWNATAGNQFTTLGFWAWMASVVLWSLALSPTDWNPLKDLSSRVQKMPQFRPRWNWTVLFFALIVLIAAYFRLHNLNGSPADGSSVPPEMTSDHVEKLLDAQRVLDGNHQVFFANNGGREPFQMYAMALFSQLPGLGMNFGTLKLLAVVESMLTLPILFLMGREIVGVNDKRFGNMVGLILALLVAVSYWHVSITRLSLRIVLTPAVVALLMIYLTRALRYNRRGDFVKAGLVLGFGLYTYQAVRMLPVVVIAAAVIAIAFNTYSWRTRLRYGLNFAALVVMALAAFVPLLGFSLDSSVQGPELFWLRASGRLFGDDVIQTTDEQGNPVSRPPTLEDRWNAFNQNLPVLVSNIRNALLMFNWKGDIAWINGVPNYPEMDVYTGSLFIIGLGAWLVLMVRRRDVVQWLVPIALLIMLMPSALSIAFPGENPSATRTSGALPFAYLIAALPLTLWVEQSLRIGNHWIGRALAASSIIFIAGGAFMLNTTLYFNDYYASYAASSLPYSEGGRFLRGFAESDGSYGNAFLIGYPSWWDVRALGIEAGRIDWANGIVTRDQLPMVLLQALQRTDSYRFDPNKDIIFFYSINDVDTQTQLMMWFPNGRDQTIVSYQAGDDFRVYRVPALGEQGFADFTAQNQP